MLNEIKYQKKVKKDNLLLVSTKQKWDIKILDLVKNAEKKYASSDIIKILVYNKYEKLVPFNLWFKHPLYKIEDHYQNNQHMRIRYYNSLTLTPLVSYNNNNLGQIRSFLYNLSLYQPFYPETFFAVWEFLQIGHLGTSDKDKFLHIGREEKLGTMEAIIFYHEKYQQTYQYNTYHCWLAGGEIYNKIYGFYQIGMPKVNYLGQAYQVKFIGSTEELDKYHFISIDTIHIFDHVFRWDNEEMDLQAILFYILSSLERLEENGSMLIRLNMICTESWSYLFHMLYNYFREYEFVRPSILHPFNPEIYLFLDKFKPKVSIRSLTNQLLKNLYRQKVYQKLYFNFSINDNQNPIMQKFLVKKDEWMDTFEKLLGNYEKNGQDYLTEWHLSNDLKQIKDLSNKFEDKSMKFVLNTASKNFKIKLILPKILYTQELYQKLIQKRAELNYYKRIMDTKPSQIFTGRNYHMKNYLLTWEQLIGQIDVYQNLKQILKKQYNAEMVTNAWIKMYEMITMFPNLVPSVGNVKTFHLCEAPGAFIASLNHLLTTRNQTLEWYAQTLKPINNSALDDHFGLIASYPNRWFFGDNNDNTGDITHTTIIKYYAKHPLLQNLDFMTADAGLQCDPRELNEQEAFLGKINMGQIVCILACLPKGKSAIFKTFIPMSEPLTISLMYLVTQLFGTVSITKPSTSHSTNSEVYIVLNNYKGIEPDLLEILYNLLDDPKITSKSLLFSQIDRIFFKTYIDSINNLIDRQISSLQRSYYYYYHLEEIDKLQETINECTEAWLRTHTIFVLEKSLLKN